VVARSRWPGTAADEGEEIYLDKAITVEKRIEAISRAGKGLGSESEGKQLRFGFSARCGKESTSFRQEKFDIICL
jgi:hypothetical protein